MCSVRGIDREKLMNSEKKIESKCTLNVSIFSDGGSNHYQLNVSIFSDEAHFTTTLFGELDPLRPITPQHKTRPNRPTITTFLCQSSKKTMKSLGENGLTITLREKSADVANLLLYYCTCHSYLINHFLFSCR